jgi:hypothetical protein
VVSMKITVFLVPMLNYTALQLRKLYSTVYTLVHYVGFWVVTACCNLVGGYMLVQPVCSSEMSVSTYQTAAWCHKPEDHTMNLHNHENLKSSI